MQIRVLSGASLACLALTLSVLGGCGKSRKTGNTVACTCAFTASEDGAPASVDLLVCVADRERLMEIARGCAAGGKLRLVDGCSCVPRNPPVPCEPSLAKTCDAR